MSEKSLERSYILLINLLEKNRWPWWKAVTFHGLCRRLKVSSDELDLFIYKELGISGQDLLYCYRNH